MKKSLLMTVGVMELFMLGVGVAGAQELSEIDAQAKKLGLSHSQITNIINAPIPHEVSYIQTIDKKRTTSDQSQIVDIAKQQLGVPFYMGGTSPSTGFDSSGFVNYVYKKALKKDIGRTVSEQWKQGKNISIDSMQPGDIVFWNNFSYNGIYVGGGEAITTIGTTKVGQARVRELGEWCGAKRIVTSENSTTISNKILNNYYASVLKKGITIYGNTSLTKTKGTTTNYYNSTFQMKRVYTIDGKKYYSAYDNNDNWIGYIREDALSTSSKTKGGYFHKQKNWYSIKNDNYKSWANFNFNQVKLNTLTEYKNCKIYAKGYYKHLNGNTYVTLYDGDNWLGYVNKNALQLEKDGFSSFNRLPKYVTVTSKGYGVFQSKDFSKKVNQTDHLYQKTYYSKGYYNVADGSSYYTLYDNHDQWIGYVNQKALTESSNDGTNKGGAYIKLSENGKVIKPNYTFWNDFNFSKRRHYSEEYLNRVFSIRGKYHHFNGAIYYSVYDGDRWLGYINKDGMQIQ